MSNVRSRFSASLRMSLISMFHVASTIAAEGGDGRATRSTSAAEYAQYPFRARTSTFRRFTRTSIA